MGSERTSQLPDVVVSVSLKTSAKMDGAANIILIKEVHVYQMSMRLTFETTWI